MKTNFYKIECITNLHVGSGDINYNVVDNEVEKDVANGLPIIHASGIKGALRDVIEKDNSNLADKIFGASGSGDKCKSGTHKFLDAYLISRPMRIYGSCAMASIPVVTLESVNQYLYLLDSFGCNTYGISKIEGIDFGDNVFLTNAYENISVEGEKTGKLKDADKAKLLKLENIIGKVFAIAKNYDDFDLPVVARNYLENGISKNLWYEEIVPHGSVFYFAVMAPEDEDRLVIPEMVQFGAHSSIGRGFTKVVKLSK